MLQIIISCIQKLIKSLHAFSQKPLASEVLTSHISQRGRPDVTSFTIYRWKVVNDQFGWSCFNWMVDDVNYSVLRTGCFPFVKYYCYKFPPEDLSFNNSFFTCLKLINLGLPTLAYGVTLWLLTTHKELVQTNKGPVYVYFLTKEGPEAGY